MRKIALGRHSYLLRDRTAAASRYCVTAMPHSICLMVNGAPARRRHSGHFQTKTLPRPPQGSDRQSFRLVCIQVLGEVFQGGFCFLVQRRWLLNGNTLRYGITGINFAPPLPRGGC